ncbi:MAG: hypothetical protein ABL855_01510, partial [Sideroxydans sp.]
MKKLLLLTQLLLLLPLQLLLPLLLTPLLALLLLLLKLLLLLPQLLLQQSTKLCFFASIKNRRKSVFLRLSYTGLIKFHLSFLKQSRANPSPI